MPNSYPIKWRSQIKNESEEKIVLVLVIVFRTRLFKTPRLFENENDYENLFHEYDKLLPFCVEFNSLRIISPVVFVVAGFVYYKIKPNY